MSASKDRKIVAMHAEIDALRQDLAAARALLEKLRLSARLYRGGGIAGQQMGNEHYSIIVTGHVLGDIDAALAGQRREWEG